MQADMALQPDSVGLEVAGGHDDRAAACGRRRRDRVVDRRLIRHRRSAGYGAVPGDVEERWLRFRQCRDAASGGEWNLLNARLAATLDRGKTRSGE